MKTVVAAAEPPERDARPSRTGTLPLSTVPNLVLDWTTPPSAVTTTATTTATTAVIWFVLR